MRSSIILKVITFSLFLILASCGRFLDEKKQSEQVIELSDKQFQCLQDWPAVIRSFFEGSATESQLRPAFQCLAKALTYFKDHTRGSMIDAYTGQDLQDFFGRYFIKEAEIPTELTQSFLKIKRAFIGGSDQYVTKFELARVVALLSPLEEQTVELSKHIKIIIMQEPRKIQETELEMAVTQLKSSLKVLLRQVELSQSEYGFEDAKIFLNQISLFARDTDSPVKAFDILSEWFPVIEAGKNVFFGESVGLRGIHEWESALNSTVDLMHLGLQYHYFIQSGLFNSPESLKATMKAGGKLLDLLEKSKQVQNGIGIPFKNIDSLIDQVVKRQLISQPLMAETLKSLYQKLVLSVLDPTRGGDSRGLNSLTIVHILSLKRELNIFRMNQLVLDSLGYHEVNHKTLRAKIQSSDIQDYISQVTTEPLEAKALTVAWGHFKKLLDQEKPVSFDSQGKIIISNRSVAPNWSWKARARFNFMHLLTRGFMLGYCGRPDPGSGICTENSLINWYEDFRDFGRDIQAFDPRSGNSGPRSFKEADFFTFRGNGDNQVNMSELFEFVSLLFSAGLVNSDEFLMHLDFRDRKGLDVAEYGTSCKSQELDIFGTPLLKTECVAREMRKLFGKVFSNLPELARYVKSLNDDEWAQYFTFLMSAAKSEFNPAEWMDTSDIRTSVTILHYAEVLFTSYDLNHDEFLTRDELLAAEPRFHEFLRPFSPVSSDFVIKEGFLDLVYTGQQPDGWSLASHGGKTFVGFLFKKKTRKASRMNIIRVFGNLKQALEADLGSLNAKSK